MDCALSSSRRFGRSTSFTKAAFEVLWSETANQAVSALMIASASRAWSPQTRAPSPQPYPPRSTDRRRPVEPGRCDARVIA